MLEPVGDADCDELLEPADEELPAADEAVPDDGDPDDGDGVDDPVFEDELGYVLPYALPVPLPPIIETDMRDILR